MARTAIGEKDAECQSCQAWTNAARAVGRSGSGARQKTGAEFAEVLQRQRSTLASVRALLRPGQRGLRCVQLDAEARARARVHRRHTEQIEALKQEARGELFRTHAKLRQQLRLREDRAILCAFFARWHTAALLCCSSRHVPALGPGVSDCHLLHPLPPLPDCHLLHPLTKDELVPNHELRGRIEACSAR